MPAVMCTDSIVSCGRTPWVAARKASSGSRKGSMRSVGSAPRSRMSATSSSCLVSAAPAARESASFLESSGVEAMSSLSVSKNPICR